MKTLRCDISVTVRDSDVVSMDHLWNHPLRLQQSRDWWRHVTAQFSIYQSVASTLRWLYLLTWPAWVYLPSTILVHNEWRTATMHRQEHGNG